MTLIQFLMKMTRAPLTMRLNACESGPDSNFIDQQASVDDYVNIDNNVLVSAPEADYTIIQEIRAGNTGDNCTLHEDENTSALTSCTNALCSVDVLKNFTAGHGLLAHYTAHLNAIESDGVGIHNSSRK